MWLSYSLLLSTLPSHTPQDVIVAKSRQLEVRQLRETLPVVLTLPIHGRILCLFPVDIPSLPTAALFFATERGQYAIISYEDGAAKTLASGHLRSDDILGTEVESGPIFAKEARCIAVHKYDGLLTFLPLNVNRPDRLLGAPIHCRIEERNILALDFLETTGLPQIALLHQDSRGSQHLTSHILAGEQLHLSGSNAIQATWLKKSAIDGGSAMVLPTPIVGNLGGVVIIGQRQLTYCSSTVIKVIPVPQALFLAWDKLPAVESCPRFLLADEFGNLHILTILMEKEIVTGLQLDTLGSCTLANSLAYLGHGLLYVGSTLGDSQLIQIHDEPIENTEDVVELVDTTTYLQVIEEYTNLGPILDFDLVPTTPGVQTGQSQVITASGSSNSGTLRLIRNGIGMNEYANVEMPGIQKMWSLRGSFVDKEDKYLVQSFVGETRVLGVVSDDEGGTLEEATLPGLQSAASSLYVGNVQAGDSLLQITDSEIRLTSLTSPDVLDTWANDAITIATANEAGQIAVALKGCRVLYFTVEGGKIVQKAETKVEREVSCMDLNPFKADNNMDVDGGEADISEYLAVGLWDDFSVRLLALESGLNEVTKVALSSEEEVDDEAAAAVPSRRGRSNMMARSLCLVTMDFNNQGAVHAAQGSSQGVNMLFVGLGDGTLISFAVSVEGGQVSFQSKKEVCLGTQQVDLVPLSSEQGGSCVLATGDRPTVIYLAGVGGSTASIINPKLCYSTVNLAASDDEEVDDVSRPPSQQAITVNVASPFYSPLLFDSSTHGDQHYSLCIADEYDLRLGVIDDIQKLHVTTCRLGMAPRRVVYCPEGRLFAVGCIESGIKNFSLGIDDTNMGNCIRFMDDTSLEDLRRIDLEPFEVITAMFYGTMKLPSSDAQLETMVPEDSTVPVKSLLLVGTAYAMPDEDEPTRGRVLVYECGPDASGGMGSERMIRQVTELVVHGAVYSMCQFYEGMILLTVNSKVLVCRLAEESGILKLEFVGDGFHGHLISLSVKSLAKPIVKVDKEAEDAMAVDSSNKKDEKDPEMLAIVGDITRSISVIQFHKEHNSVEQLAHDYCVNWTTAVEMVTDDLYLGAENFNNLYRLVRNKDSKDEAVRERLDNVGEFHLGEMCNKFMSGSLVMPVKSTSTSSKENNRRTVRRSSPQKRRKATDSPAAKAPSAHRVLKPVVTMGSQTLFGTVDGTLGVILGLDSRTTAFFSCLQRCLAKVVAPVGGISHELFRARQVKGGFHPATGFVDGDLVESFLDLDRPEMEAVVAEMNRDGGWELNELAESSGDSDHVDFDLPELSVDDVLAMVEEISMMH